MNDVGLELSAWDHGQDWIIARWTEKNRTENLTPTVRSSQGSKKALTIARLELVILFTPLFSWTLCKSLNRIFSPFLFSSGKELIAFLSPLVRSSADVANGHKGQYKQTSALDFINLLKFCRFEPPQMCRICCAGSMTRACRANTSSTRTRHRDFSFC